MISTTEVDGVSVIVTAKHGDNAKLPISVHIAHSGPIGCYIYCMPSRDGTEVFATPLQNTDDHQLFDTTRGLASVLAKKFHRPIYLSISTMLDQHQYWLVLQEIIRMLGQQII